MGITPLAGRRPLFSHGQTPTTLDIHAEGLKPSFPREKLGDGGLRDLFSSDYELLDKLRSLSDCHVSVYLNTLNRSLCARQFHRSLDKSSACAACYLQTSSYQVAKNKLQSLEPLPRISNYIQTHQSKPVCEKISILPPPLHYTSFPPLFKKKPKKKKIKPAAMEARGIEPRTSSMLKKRYTTKPCPPHPNEFSD